MGIGLYQHKYSLDLLKHVRFFSAKPTFNPMDPYQELDIENDEIFIDPTQF